ncbi:DNA-binding response regulator [Streptomyces sp. NPDC005322]|uniref:DNA-binding response regulator n=1 Tax=Streptomyces sp. NPDC005322 TaxID=3157032 RepID=UPI0033AE17D9
MDDRGRDPGPEAASPVDALEHTLREVRGLIESTVVQHRARRSRSEQFAEVGREDAAFLAAAEQVIGQAGRSLDAVFPDPSARMAAGHAALTALLEDRDAGVRVRVLRGRPGPGPAAVPPPGPAPVPIPGPAPVPIPGPAPVPIPGPAADLEARVPAPPAAPGLPQVRIAAVPLPTAVIADGRTALVCTETAQGRQTSVVLDPVVVATMHGMFGSIWGGAVPAARPLDFGNRARTEMVRRVLARLRDGVTDEAAARDLAISVRTYRRYVTGILELLAANSRFQAGVRATELGILGDR